MLVFERNLALSAMPEIHFRLSLIAIVHEGVIDGKIPIGQIIEHFVTLQVPIQAERNLEAIFLTKRSILGLEVPFSYSLSQSRLVLIH